MMRWIALASLCLVSGMMLNGCLAVGTSNSVRVDGGMKYEYKAAERGGGIHKWILPERRSINRIEVYFDPIEPLKNFIVYAQLGRDNWRIVKEVKTPVRTSPYVISTALSTDAIRIVNFASLGAVREIVLYGSAPKGSGFEDIKPKEIED